MTKEIVHPSYGQVRYSAVYFSLEEPVLFSCYFENTPDKYVGVMVEDFENGNNRIQSFYFVGVLENELRILEKKPGKLRELFDHRPVLWFNRHSTGREVWEKHQGVMPFYSFSEFASLR